MELRRLFQVDWTQQNITRKITRAFWQIESWQTRHWRLSIVHILLLLGQRHLRVFVVLLIVSLAFLDWVQFLLHRLLWHLLVHRDCVFKTLMTFLWV